MLLLLLIKKRVLREVLCGRGLGLVVGLGDKSGALDDLLSAAICAASQSRIATDRSDRQQRCRGRALADHVGIDSFGVRFCLARIGAADLIEIVGGCGRGELEKRLCEHCLIDAVLVDELGNAESAVLAPAGHVLGM